MNKLKNKRIGEHFINNNGDKITVIDYKNYKNVLIEFEDGTQKWCNYNNLKKGVCKNPKKPIVYGVGFCSFENASSLYPKEYMFWQGMLRRCYSNKWKSNHTVYKNVTCCKEWFDFKVFLNWTHSQSNWQYLMSSNDRFELDKDIIKKHNNYYSPETCCYVPQKINKIFTKHDKKRGNYPIGVNYNKKGQCFEAYCMNNKGERFYKSSFQTPIEAFVFYKTEKEKIIKQIAEEEFNKGSITRECYLAMIHYQVEIID